MFNKINEIITKLSLDNWLYICLGVIAVVFVFGFIFSFATGEIKNFKKVAKRSLKNPFASKVSENAKLLPIKSRKLFERAKNSGEKPSDVMGVEAVVLAPYATSFAAKFCKVVLATSAFMTALMYAIANIIAIKSVATITIENIYTAIALVVVAGLLLSFLAGLVSVGIRHSAIKTYSKYIDMLDRLILSSDEKAESAQEPKNTINNIGNDALFASLLEDKKPTESVVDEPIKVAPIVEESIKPVIVDVEAEQKAKAREQAAKDEQAKLAAIAADNAAKVAAQAAAAKVAATNSADEVIAKIDKISREGAPFSAMKEVAQQLQQERSKPENKTPDQARRLNDALTVLLRAMSNATRR